MPIYRHSGEVDFEGAVLDKGERNFYDDSDFYAVVWDGVKVTSIEYDTTRFAGGGRAVIDATDEVKAKADDYLEAWAYEVLQNDDLAASRKPAKGKRVRVVQGRKVPLGTEGVIFWAAEVNYDRYGREWGRQTKIGIALSDEKETVTKTRRDGSTYEVEGFRDVAWTYAHNVEVIEPELYRSADADLRKQAKTVRGNYRAMDMYASARAGLLVA